MADRTLSFSVFARDRASETFDRVGRAARRASERVESATERANQSLGRFRGGAFKAAAGIAALNAAATSGHVAIVLLAGVLAALPVALAGIGIAGAAMDERVQAAFGNLATRAKETLREIGEPLVGPLIAGAESLGRAFDSVAPYLREISEAAAPLVSGLFAKIEQFADDIGPKLPGAFENAIPVVEGFAELIGKVGAAVGRFFSSGDILDGDNLKATFTAAGDTIAGFLDRIRQIGDVLEPFISQIADGLEPVIESLVGAFDWLLEKLEPISAWFEEHPTIITSVATAIGIVTVALTALSVVMAIVNAVMLLSPFTWIVIGIVALIAIIILCIKHWDAIKAAMSRLWDWIKSVFIKGWDWLKTKVGDAVEGAKRLAERAFNGLLSFVKRYTLVGLVVSQWDNIRSRVSQLAGRIRGAVVDRFNGIVSFARGLPGRMASALRGLFDGVVSAGRSAFSSVAGLWNRTVGSISFSAPDWLPAIGGQSWSVPNVPTFATGVRSFRGGLAIVGERGPEVVNMPPGSDVYSNADSQHMLAGAGGPLIGNVYMQPDESPAALGERVYWLLKTRG